MRRSGLQLAAVLTFAVTACDGSPTDPNVGPDGQIIPTTCEESNTVDLGIGASAEFLGAYARFFCLEGEDPDGRLDYVITVHSAGTSAPTFVFEANNSILPTPLSAPAAVTAVSPELVPDDAFHIELRKREIEELSGLIAGPGTPGTLAPAAPAAIPAVGEVLQLNAHANPGGVQNGGCNLELPVSARVEAVSSRAIVVADVDNPAGGFTQSDYENYAQQFDETLVPLSEAHFGPTTDIDGNGRTILLFTKEVNRLTTAGAGSFTAGFFYARDLFPRQGDGRLGACPQSNEAEILYLLVPDPGGIINGNDLSRFDVDRIILGTVIHEYQHLTNGGRRLHINRLPTSNWSEEPWLNEGLSHIAEELLFYAASGLEPGNNLRDLGLLATFALDRYQRHNFLRFFDFLESPESNGPFDPQLSLATRGAVWSFLRYLADRAPDQESFFFDLVDSRTGGIENLTQVVGTTDQVFDRLADWHVAVYADDRVFGLDDRHRTLSWDLPAMHREIGSGGYPIRYTDVGPGEPVDGFLGPGGAAYLRVGKEPGAQATIDILSNGGLPPSTVRATVLRVR